MNANEISDMSSEEHMLVSALTIMKIAVQEVNEDYVRQCADKFHQDAMRYDSYAALNRQWNEHGGKLRQAMTDQLTAFADFMKAGKEVDRLRRSEKATIDSFESISKIFR